MRNPPGHEILRDPNAGCPEVKTAFTQASDVQKHLGLKKKIVYGVQGINFLDSSFTTDTTSLSTESTCKSDIIWGVESGYIQ